MSQFCSLFGQTTTYRFSLAFISLSIDSSSIPYRTKFRRTKFSTDKIFRRTKFSTPSRNFDSFVRFLPDFCIEILDKIFDGQNVSSDKIFDTKLKFRHFCPTNFCPIRYIKWGCHICISRMIRKG